MCLQEEHDKTLAAMKELQQIISAKEADLAAAALEKVGIRGGWPAVVLILLLLCL